MGRSAVCAGLGLAGLALVLLVGHAHLGPARHLAAVYATWRSRVPEVAIYPFSDGFDTTFANYPMNQTASEVSSRTGGDPVPPIMHHILLGMSIDAAPEGWRSSRQSCIDLHPDWTHYLWDDAKAMDLLTVRTFPFFGLRVLYILTHLGFPLEGAFSKWPGELQLVLFSDPAYRCFALLHSSSLRRGRSRYGPHLPTFTRASAAV
jgi:hypothetical protein